MIICNLYYSQKHVNAHLWKLWNDFFQSTFLYIFHDISTYRKFVKLWERKWQLAAMEREDGIIRATWWGRHPVVASSGQLHQDDDNKWNGYSCKVSRFYWKVSPSLLRIRFFFWRRPFASYHPSVNTLHIKIATSYNVFG